VLKCDTDTIVREIDLASDYYSLIRVGTDRLVCWGAFGHVTLVDCRTDSILVDSVLEANIYAAARSGSDKVYVRRNGRLEARSANTLALLSTTDWPYSRTAWQQQFLACSDSTHKLYWFAHDWTMKDSVLVIDTRSDTVVARMQVDFTQRPGCFDRSGRYLFCSNPDSNTLIVYDTQSDTVAAVYATLPYPVAVVPNPELGCIYVGCADAILAYPDTLVVPGVCEEPASVLKRSPQTILRTLDAKEMSTAVWFDVAGRRVAVRPTGSGGKVLGPGVYLAPGAGRAAAKIVVIR
jgi:DNA-binding beta-propeller fold protein YncE